MKTSSDASSVASLSKMEIEFNSTLEALWHSIDQNPEQKYFQADLLPFLYSSAVPSCRFKSGADLSEELFSGGDIFYPLPREEYRFVISNENVFPQLIVPGAILVSIGCGPHVPVLMKDTQLCRAFRAAGYIAIDINGEQARQAHENVRDRIPGLATAFLEHDVTRPFNLHEINLHRLDDYKRVQQEIIGNRPIIIIMLGGTAGNVDLNKVLTNLREATNNRAVAMLTIGADKHPIAASKYKGPVMEGFMRTLWWSAADVLTRRGSIKLPDGKVFDPNVFEPLERYDPATCAVKHEVFVAADTFAPIGHRIVKIPQGIIIRTGISQQAEPQDLVEPIGSAGWQIIQTPFRYDGIVRAVCMTTEQTPKSWIPILG